MKKQGSYKVDPVGMGFVIRGHGRKYQSSDMKDLASTMNKILDQDPDSIFLGPNPPGASMGVYIDAMGNKTWKLLGKQGQVLRSWKGPHWIMDRDAVVRFLGFSAGGNPEEEWDVMRSLRRVSLRDKVIRLAYERPELRKDLVPILKEKSASRVGAEQLFTNWYSGNKNTSAKALLDKWFRDSKCRNGITSDIHNALMDEMEFASESESLVYEEARANELVDLITKHILQNYGVTKEFARGIAHQIINGENY